MNIAVRTNLNFDGLVRRQAKRPARLATRGAIIIGVAALALWGGLHLELHHTRALHAASEARKAELSGQLQAARDAAAERNRRVVQRDAILTFARNRWNWAPVLEQLFAAMPANSEITALQIKDPGDTERLLLVKGRSAGLQPRLESDKCRLLLLLALEQAGYGVSAHFLSLEDSASTVQFDETNHATAEFLLEFRFPAKADERKT